MRQCSGLFIAAPINRAVNDKAAQNLPSAQFKRQMKLDGLLSSVTFIGTTTDNITVSEALRTLELDEDLKDIELQFEESVKQEEALEMELEQAKTNISDITQAFRDAGPNMKEWSALKSSCKKGYRVVAPAPKPSTKRKRTTRSDKKTSKRGKRADDSDSADEQTSESSDDFDELDESDDDMATQPALTMDQILAKLEKLKATREKARENREAATSHKNDIEAKIKSTKQARRELKGKRKMVCISGRNAWSRTRIQDDYARGIKELDQECAEQEDGDDFDPSVELRDYRQMAHTLPVFCVSSKSFQILSGRFQSDEASPGFTSADETEIPQLKAHCLQLTGKARIKSSMAFLDGFTKLFFSYVCGHPAAPQASSYQMQSASARRRTFKMGFRKWIEALELVKRRLCRRLTRFFLDNIQKFFPKACQGATEASFTKGLLWSQREDKGDVHWGTYRAIIRRNGGPYKNPKGSYDFNKELGLLFEKYITAGWDKSFQTVVPDTIRRHAADMTKALTSFHDDVSKRAKRYPTGQYAVGIMSTKLALFQRDIARGLESVNEAVVSMQKVANRQVAPVIAAAMDATYKKCATESGMGCTRWMRDHMERFIQSMAQNIFQKCAKVLDKHLLEIREKLKTDLSALRTSIFEEIQRDYLSIMIGMPNGGKPMDKAERKMREQLHKQILKASVLFNDMTTNGTAELCSDVELRFGKEELAGERERSMSTFMPEQDADEILNEVSLAEPTKTMPATAVKDEEMTDAGHLA